MARVVFSLVLSLACFVAALHAVPSNRIVNGQDATPGQFPIQAFLNVTLKGNQPSRCGGSLLSDRWILTAAHCLDDLQKVDVYLGAHDLGKTAEPNRVVRKGSKWLQHEKYIAETLVYDLGLIQLDEPVEVNDFIKLTKLAKEETPAGSVVTVSGWGVYKERPNFETPDVLQFTNTKLLSRDQCKKVWGDYVRDYTICVQEGKTSICRGDSGGPLVHKGVQIGVVSFGTVPCSRGNPQGFVNVIPFLDWIREKTGLDL